MDDASRVPSRGSAADMAAACADGEAPSYVFFGMPLVKTH